MIDEIFRRADARPIKFAVTIAGCSQDGEVIQDNSNDDTQFFFFKKKGKEKEKRKKRTKKEEEKNKIQRRK